MPMKPKVKLILSFVTGAICSFFVTCVIIGATQNILSDDEYNDYLCIRNRDNLIAAYQEYFKDSIKLLGLIDNNYFEGNISEYIEESTWTIFNNDIGLVEAMEKANQSKTPSRYSISHKK